MSAATAVHVPSSTFYQFMWPTTKHVRLEKVFVVSAPHLAENLAIASNQRPRARARIAHLATSWGKPVTEVAG